MLTRIPLNAMLLAAVWLLGPALGWADDDFGPPRPPRIEKPSLRIDENTFDWGTVLHGDTIDHTFEVHNDGAGILKIIRVKST